MQVEVDKEDKTVSVVEAVHIRDREFEPFAFRINEEAMPEPVGSYLPKEKKTGRPIKGPFDPDKEIPKNVHRPALDAVFANGNISNYDDYIVTVLSSLSTSTCMMVSALLLSSVPM